MDSPAAAIPLQNQDTRALMIAWVFLDHCALNDASVNILDQDTIRSQLIITMLGDYDFAACDQVENSVKNLAHPGFMIILLHTRDPTGPLIA